MQWAARSQWQVQHQQQRRQTRVLSYRSDTLCVPQLGERNRMKPKSRGNQIGSHESAGAETETQPKRHNARLSAHTCYLSAASVA